MAAEPTTEQTPLMDEVREVIEGNGTIPQSRINRLMLAIMAEIYNDVKTLKDIPDRVKDLEKRSLVNLACQHPKAAITISFAVVTVIVLAARYEPLWLMLKKWAGVP